MSAAMLSAIEAMKDFNSILRAEIDKPVKISLPKGPLDPEKIKITAVKNYNSGNHEAVAFYVDGRNRRLIKLGEIFETEKEAKAAARRIGREVKSGKRVLQFPEV